MERYLDENQKLIPKAPSNRLKMITSVMVAERDSLLSALTKLVKRIETIKMNKRYNNMLLALFKIGLLNILGHQTINKFLLHRRQK